MHLIHILSFAGLLLPCLANPIENSIDLIETGVASPSEVDDISARGPECCDEDGKKKKKKKTKEPSFCEKLQPKFDSDAWNTTEINDTQCFYHNYVSRARKEWEIKIPNSRIFDEIPHVHHEEDCGERLLSQLRGPGWRHRQCTMTPDGTATIKLFSYRTASKESVDRAIKRATCGQFETYPLCYRSVD